MKLTKRSLIQIIKEEIGNIREGHDEGEVEDHEPGKAPLSQEAKDFIVDSIHDMLRQLEDMKIDRYEHYWTILGVIRDDAIDSYSHPNKLSYSDPGFSDDE